MFSRVARPAQIDEAQWQELLSAEPFLELIVARLPLDTFIGVKTHRLNELWSLGPIKFSDWLQRAGRRYTRGAYGVHISDTRCHNKINDTFFCFSGPCGMIPPWSRGVKFKLIDITDVE